jgi:hypothetical protein
VPDHVRPLAAGGVDQPHDIGGQPVEGIGPDARGLVAGVVAALVDRPHLVARGGQGGNLPPPAVPELGETVQQQHQRAVGRAGLGHVQADAVAFDMAMLDRATANLPRVGVVHQQSWLSPDYDE